MRDKQARNLKDSIRLKARREVILAENTGTPWLTIEEAAARVGLSPFTLRNWIVDGVIPKPLKWPSANRKSFRRPDKKMFRRSYVETMLQLMIIRTNSGQRPTEQFTRNLMWTPLFGLR